MCPRSRLLHESKCLKGGGRAGGVVLRPMVCGGGGDCPPPPFSPRPPNQLTLDPHNRLIIAHDLGARDRLQRARARHVPGRWCSVKDGKGGVGVRRGGRRGREGSAVRQSDWPRSGGSLLLARQGAPLLHAVGEFSRLDHFRLLFLPRPSRRFVQVLRPLKPGHSHPRNVVNSEI